MQSYQVVIETFDSCFLKEFNTRLVAGGNEPEYLPADSCSAHHRIIFREDYLSSALHEVAHWCVAGADRRKQLDYGYWYAPDGRTSEQQRAFEQVEIKPQALEWLFSNAVGTKFRLSADNLSGGEGVSHSFAQAVAVQAAHYCSHGVNQRTKRFIDALCRAFVTPNPFQFHLYKLDKLFL